VVFGRWNGPLGHVGQHIRFRQRTGPPLRPAGGGVLFRNEDGQAQARTLLYPYVVLREKVDVRVHDEDLRLFSERKPHEAICPNMPHMLETHISGRTGALVIPFLRIGHVVWPVDTDIGRQRVRAFLQVKGHQLTDRQTGGVVCQHRGQLERNN